MTKLKKFNELVGLAEKHYNIKKGLIDIPKQHLTQFNNLVEELVVHFDESPNFLEILTFLRLERVVKPGTPKYSYLEAFWREFKETVDQEAEAVSDDDTSYESSYDENKICVKSPLKSPSSESSDENDFEWIKRKPKPRDASPIRPPTDQLSSQPNPPRRYGPKPAIGSTYQDDDDDLLPYLCFEEESDSWNDPNDILTEEPIGFHHLQPQREAIADGSWPVQREKPPPPHQNFVQLWELQRACQLKRFLEKKNYSWRTATVIALGFLSEASCSQIADFIYERMLIKCKTRHVAIVMRTDRLSMRGFRVYKDRRLFVHPEKENLSMRGIGYSLSQNGYDLYEELVK